MRSKAKFASLRSSGSQRSRPGPPLAACFAGNTVLAKERWRLWPKWNQSSVLTGWEGARAGPAFPSGPGLQKWEGGEAAALLLRCQVSTGSHSGGSGRGMLDFPGDKRWGGAPSSDKEADVWKGYFSHLPCLTSSVHPLVLFSQQLKVGHHRNRPAPSVPELCHLEPRGTSVLVTLHKGLERHIQFSAKT